MLGQSISAVEISVASNQGFWLLVDDEELYMPFDEFPWFKRATFEQVMLVERPGSDHLYWPLLDIDLSIQSIRHPEKFPLISSQNNRENRENRGQTTVSTPIPIG